MTAQLPPMASRVAGYRPSKVREVFARSSDPGMISLAGGQPFLGDMPFDELSALATRILTEQGPSALQYSFGVGIEPLRRQIAEIMALEGMDADPDDVCITAGSQMALEALCKILIDPGGVVLAEGPAYAGGLSAITSYETDCRHIPCDADGMIVAEAARLVEQVESEGKRVSMMYSIPTFQNPSNAILTPERRDALVRLCRDHGILLIEDNAYGLLSFDGSTVRAMAADHPDQIAYLGSFSKMFAPGLRLGWVVAPPQYKAALKDTIETFMLNPPTFGQMLMSAYLSEYPWREKLAEMRGLYERRCRALDAALRHTMPPEVTWRTPTGSFYLWLTLPPELDSMELCAQAMDRGVVFVPGTAFYIDDGGHHEARLSYCLPNEAELDRAGRVLGELFTAELERARG